MATLVNTLIRLGLSLCIGLTCPAQQKSGTDTSLDGVRRAIAARDRLYFGAFVKGDSTLLTTLYTEDCWILPPEGPTLCGPDAPLELFQVAYHQFGLRDGRLITADVFGDGVNFVTEEGYWECYDDERQLLDKGSYLVLWRKTAGGWKIFRQALHRNREKSTI